MTAVALDGVQAHVLRQASPALTDATFCFLRVEDRSQARDLVRRLLDERLTLSDAEARRRPPGRRDDPCVVVGFTRSGLECMGITYAPNRAQVPLDQPDAFCAGMAARAGLLGDPPTDDWDGTGCNALLWAAASAADSSSHWAEVRAVIDDSGAEVVHEEPGANPAQGEATVLGFRDGVSQPFVSELASSRERLPGGGTVTPDGWCPVPLGEFVLGSTDAGDERLLPQPAWLATGGTYLVYRKYEFRHQDFETFLAKAGADYEDATGQRDDDSSCRTVAAKLVGRYRLGESPPDRPAGHDAVISGVPSGDGAPPGPNDFRYRHDTYGHSCPLGAHIRRANPRDALGFDGNLTVRHRILRRGLPWEEDARKGLHFVGVNARIHDQFEFIQRQWLNGGSAFRLGGDIDLLAGSWRTLGDEPDERVARFVIQGRDPVVLRATRPFTHMLGGDYFLVPGMHGLRVLAEERG
jgi:Dyp-type peroxidase family